MNPLLRPLLGSGRLPEPLRAELAREGLLLLEEALSGSITYRRYRAPGVRARWKKQLVSGAIAVTRQRLVVSVRRAKHIDVPLAGTPRRAIEVVAERPDRMLFAYEASEFSESRSGRVELRLRTPQVDRLAVLLGVAPPA